MSGKGDKRRPTDEAAFSEGWDRVFGNKEQDATDGDSRDSDDSSALPD